MHYTLPREVAVPKRDTDARFGIVKAYQRIWIQDRYSGILLYTYPDFIKLINRNRMQGLADAANTRGWLDIDDIIAFERSQPRAWGFSKNSRIN
jgi:hypothetical protein